MSVRAAPFVMPVLVVAILVIAALVGASPAFARTWYILPDGSGDAPTIQAGIDSAVFGDVVLAAAGTYVESLVMDLGITLRGESGAASTIVQALPGTSCVRCEGLSSVLLEGLTLAGGSGTLLGSRLAGGNILVFQSQIEVRDCVIRDGRLVGVSFVHDYTQGGGIACIDGSIANLDGCAVESNYVYGDPEFGPNARGGGIYIDGSSEMALRNSRVADNHAITGGGIASDNLVFSAEDCRIEGNVAWHKGGGFEGAGILRNCTFSENAASGLYAFGGGIYLTQGLVENCLIVRNTTGNRGGGGIYADNWAGDVTIRGNTIFGNTFFDPSWSIDGAGIVMTWDPEASGAIVLENNLVATNGPHQVSSGIQLDGCPPSLTFRCNNSWGHLWDYAGCGDPFVDGNFSADPLFCDAESDDFTLDAHSPCLPGQHPGGADCGLIGAFDFGCGDPSATDPVSWGSLKHGFHSAGHQPTNSGAAAE